MVSKRYTLPCRDARLCLVGGRPLCQGDTCNPLRCHVGTHGLCVRCVKGYSVKVLTGTDALRLGTPVRPYIIVTRHECPLCQGDTCNPLRCHVGTHGLCVRCGCWLLVVAKI